MGRIKLTVGAVTESVSVTATATPVQTASSENSSMVDFEQMAHVTVRGRDLMSLLQTLPGVNFGTNFLTGGSSGQGNYETVNPFALGALNLNGMGSAANYTVDGVTGMDMAGDSLTTFSPNVDAVAEVKVLSTNYAAEFGRNMGGQVQVVTKSGTQQFHGSVNVNKRHEMFNANSFFNNYNGQPKSFYRFMDETYSIGGPVYIPHHFNVNKNKVFFFVSQDYLGQRSNPASGYANVPNPNQRAGDFSYYPNASGQLHFELLAKPRDRGVVHALVGSGLRRPLQRPAELRPVPRQFRCSIAEVWPGDAGSPTAAEPVQRGLRDQRRECRGTELPPAARVRI